MTEILPLYSSVIDRNKQINAGCTWKKWGGLSSYQESNEIHSLPTMGMFSSKLNLCTDYLCWRDAVLWGVYFSSFLSISNSHLLSQLYLEQTSDFLLSIFGWIQLNILQWIISERFLFLGFYFLANFQVSLRLEKVLSHQTISEEPEIPAEVRWGEVSDYYLIQLSLWSQLAPALSLSLSPTHSVLTAQLSNPLLWYNFWLLNIRT